MSGLFWNDYPYTDFHELNLTWLIKKMIELNETVKNFVSLNTIKYADPIQWNIATQYEKNTVVVDPQTGTAYLSVAPVPSGVALSNTDYWSVIFDLDIAQANNNITLRDDSNNVLSTFTSVEGDWLLWNGTLYKVIRDIDLSQAYVPGYNIERYTVELFVKDYLNNVLAKIGDLDDLDTTDKTSLVNSINEIFNISTYARDKVDNFTFKNVRDFGAVGDGTTDDSSAIASAFASAGTDFAVYFPSGVYKVTQTFNVSSPYVFGDGEASEIVYYGNDKLFTPVQGVTFHNLKLQADDNTSSIGIYVLDKNFVVIDSVWLNDFYDCIVFDGTCFYCTCTRLKGFHWGHAFVKTQDTAGTSTGGHQIAFENITFASGEGDYVFYLDNIGSFNFSDVLCSPNKLTVSSIYWGTMAPLAGLSWLTNVGLESAPVSMKFDANYEHYYFYFANCYFGAPLDLVRCRQMSFTNCYFTGDAIGCKLYLTQEISFIGCHFLNGLHSCLNLLGGTYDTSLISCSNPNTGTYPFVTRVDNTQGVKIVACTIKTDNIESLTDMTNVIMSSNNKPAVFTEVIETISAPIVINTNLDPNYSARKYCIVPINANAINAEFDCTLSAGNTLVCYSHGTYDTTQPVKIMAYAEL